MSSGLAYDVKKGLLRRKRQIRVGGDRASLEVVRKGELRSEWSFQNVNGLYPDVSPFSPHDHVSLYWNIKGLNMGVLEPMEIDIRQAKEFLTDFYQAYAEWLTPSGTEGGLWFPLFAVRPLHLKTGVDILPVRSIENVDTKKVYRYIGHVEPSNYNVNWTPSKPPTRVQLYEDLDVDVTRSSFDSSKIVVANAEDLHELPPQAAQLALMNFRRAKQDLPALTPLQPFAPQLISVPPLPSSTGDSVRDTARVVLDFFGGLNETTKDNPFVALLHMVRGKKLDEAAIEASIFRAYFRAADTDNNGYLDISELQAVVKDIATAFADEELHTASLTKESMEKLFQKVDLDKNGQISESEFIEMMKRCTA